jgi:hypothetical protein
MIALKIDSNELIKATRKLELLNRSAFPVAVRGTLNSAAYEMKQQTIDITTRENFTIRKATFFKANSKVVQATGFDVNQMQATVGFTGNSQAVEDLQQQETGGTILGRAFIPLNTARTGNSNTKLVRSSNRIKGIRIIDARKNKGNAAQQFIQAAKRANVGDFILANYQDRTILWRLNSLNRNSDGSFKLTGIYSYDKGRSAKIDKATHFMQKATLLVQPKIADMYLQQAERQFAKALSNQ